MNTGTANPTLQTTRLTFVDVETTGFAPAWGDRIIEVGLIVCRGRTETARLAQLVHPARPIPRDARGVHGIGDEHVKAAQQFPAIAEAVASMIDGTVIVGHCVRFDAGFLAMELANAGHLASPFECLDTCQLAAAVWELPNYRLQTVAGRLGIAPTGAHRAERDAEVCRTVFHRIVRELGGWSRVSLADLRALHTHPVAWPAEPRHCLPPRLYDALTSGREVSIGYVNGDGRASQRVIRPVGCFPAGRFTYIRAWCSQPNELRTFRLDRISSPPAAQRG